MLADKFIRLSGGRELAFNEYGDPRGKPVFYFHGWPGSRLSGAETDAAAKSLGLRMISPDRPGFGLSDFQPNRTLLGWADDVSELADQLNIKKFTVMGVSGGGPYAAVCSFALPARITKTAIVVGLSPLDSPDVFTGMIPLYAWSWRHYHRYPIVRTVGTFAMYSTVCSPILSTLNRNSVFNSPEDREIVKELSTIQIREAFRHGIKGPEYDLKLYTDDWGFSLSRIKVPVDLWYAPSDKSAPLAMGKYYASRIPQSKLHLFPSGGHLCRLRHESEILSSLLSRT
jgi:pimeloyl-ACP methyl ester carboxylesterase